MPTYFLSTCNMFSVRVCIIVVLIAVSVYALLPNEHPRPAPASGSGLYYLANSGSGGSAKSPEVIAIQGNQVNGQMEQVEQSDSLGRSLDTINGCVLPTNCPCNHVQPETTCTDGTWPGNNQCCRNQDKLFADPCCCFPDTNKYYRDAKGCYPDKNGNYPNATAQYPDGTYATPCCLDRNGYGCSSSQTTPTTPSTTTTPSTPSTPTTPTTPTTPSTTTTPSTPTTPTTPSSPSTPSTPSTPTTPTPCPPRRPPTCSYKTTLTCPRGSAPCPQVSPDQVCDAVKEGAVSKSYCPHPPPCPNYSVQDFVCARVLRQIQEYIHQLVAKAYDEELDLCDTSCSISEHLCCDQINKLVTKLLASNKYLATYCPRLPCPNCLQAAVDRIEEEARQDCCLKGATCKPDATCNCRR